MAAVTNDLVHSPGPGEYVVAGKFNVYNPGENGRYKRIGKTIIINSALQYSEKSTSLSANGSKIY